MRMRGRSFPCVLALLLTVAGLLVLLPAPAARADVTGSKMTMDSPITAPNPLSPTAIPFVFSVQKDILYEEPIVHIWTELPACMRVVMGTTFYEEIEPGRPDFIATLVGRTVVWVEQNPIDGGIHRDEATSVGFIGVFASIPVGGTPLVIQWWLVGNLGSDCTGFIVIPENAPVQASTWGSIKALYNSRTLP